MITYRDFCNILVHFEEEENFAANFRNLLYQYDKREFIDPYCFQDSSADEFILILLEDIFQDKSHWISYFIYDLDFGREYRDGCITDNNGNIVCLRTKQDLWNLLMENLRNDDN